MERLDHFIRGPSIHFVPVVSETTALYVPKPKSDLSGCFYCHLETKRAKLIYKKQNPDSTF